MRHHKQTNKKRYVAPTCETYQMRTCHLMGISAGVGGFEASDLDNDSIYAPTKTGNLQN